MSVWWYLEDEDNDELYTRNFTYNYGPMIRRLGLVDILYNGSGVKASEAGPKLQKALGEAREIPGELTAMEPRNKWGTYPLFLQLLEELVEACDSNPNGVIRISR